jgi:hypothetical protein
MKWFKRCLWLSAWSVWLWLGMGLWRELPRHFGPTVFTVPLGERVMALGWVGDSDVFAIQRDRSGDGQTMVVIFDVEAGRELDLKSPVPLMKRTFMDANRPAFQVFRSTIRQGVLFGTNPSERREDGRGTREGVQVLDVMTGQWRRLSDVPVVYMAAHPTKPWDAIVERETPTQDRVVVVERTTGKELFSHRLPTGAMKRRPFFVSGSEDLIVLATGWSKSEMTLEIWRLSDPPVLVGKVEGLSEAAQQFSISPSGRIHFSGILRGNGMEAEAYDVYGLHERKLLSSVAPEDQPAQNQFKLSWQFDMAFSPQISASGGAVLRYSVQSRGMNAAGKDVRPVELYEVGSGRIMWTPSRFETVDNSSIRNGFRVAEQWDKLWEAWLPKLKFLTHAHRSLEDGRLLFRTFNAPPLSQMLLNASQTFVVMPDGAVHRLPLLCNYPLLALCQTILALPLIFLWAILRWRSRRASRRQRNVPLHNDVQP